MAPFWTRFRVGSACVTPRAFPPVAAPLELGSAIVFHTRKRLASELRVSDVGVSRGSLLPALQRDASTPTADRKISGATTILAAILGLILSFLIFFVVWKWSLYHWKRRVARKQRKASRGTFSYVSSFKSRLSASSNPFKAYTIRPNTQDRYPNWAPQIPPVPPVATPPNVSTVQRRNTLNKDEITPPSVAKTFVSRASSAFVFGKSLPPIPATTPERTDRSSLTNESIGTSASPVRFSNPATSNSSLYSSEPSIEASPAAAQGAPKPVDSLPEDRHEVYIVPSPGAQSQELEIPDFHYQVPNTPRYSSLPRNNTSPSPSTEPYLFPSTPPSIAARYAEAYRILITPLKTPGSSGHRLPRLVKAVGTFPPSLPDELRLTVGESLRLLQTFVDDWCLVERLYLSGPPVSGNSRVLSTMPTGAVPMLCLMELDGTPLIRSRGLSSNLPTSEPSLSSSKMTSTKTELEPRSYWSSSTTNARNSSNARNDSAWRDKPQNAEENQSINGRRQTQSRLPSLVQPAAMMMYNHSRHDRRLSSVVDRTRAS